MSSTNDPRSVVADPQWLPVHWDAGGKAVQFAWVPRARHAELTFLEDEYLIEIKPDVVTIALAELQSQSASDIPPPHYIFHSAFCCSTLLARALDAPGVAIGLKEPQILNELAEAARAGSLPVDTLDAVVKLLARPFAAGEVVVIKPSNVVNVLADALMQIDGRSRAILLYAPLEQFLGSLAGKGMWGRIWGRRLFALLRRDVTIELGLTQAELFELTDLQISGLAWLLHWAQFASLLAKFPGRMRTLDSRAFLARRTETLVALGCHLDLSIDAQRAREIVLGPAFKIHSKEIGRNFEPDLVEARRPVPIIDDEIGMVSTWVRSVGNHIGVPDDLPGAALLASARSDSRVSG